MHLNIHPQSFIFLQNYHGFQRKRVLANYNSRWSLSNVEVYSNRVFDEKLTQKRVSTQTYNLYEMLINEARLTKKMGYKYSWVFAKGRRMSYANQHSFCASWLPRFPPSFPAKTR